MVKEGPTEDFAPAVGATIPAPLRMTGLSETSRAMVPMSNMLTWQELNDDQEVDTTYFKALRRSV